MRIIPVLDIKDGHVVRAVRGDRDRYAPMSSQLCRSNAPRDMALALMALYPFAALYVADLDAIMRRGDNRTSIEALRRALPGLELWVDCGIGDADALTSWMALGLGRPVLGTESIADFPVLEAAAGLPNPPLLSLDSRAGVTLDPAGIARRPESWPREVIVMTLERVGSGHGPDLDRLAQCRRLAPRCEFYSAGGVRGAGDLETAAAAGAAGVLVASSLHDGRLIRADLERLGD